MAVYADKPNASQFGEQGTVGCEADKKLAVDDTKSSKKPNSGVKSNSLGIIGVLGLVSYALLLY